MSFINRTGRGQATLLPPLPSETPGSRHAPCEPKIADVEAVDERIDDADEGIRPHIVFRTSG